ncbi:CdaR family transcriptional regulator [Diplocloster modestus]|uniref:Helix-turn-helix domain-containing protein n=1 Tax=Diplocloster modestus TaxID=2850322 RepID=A0ABS6K7C3_9FIRM|nr:sugar diacid recognition domain-containing protein [Diplocloster modestus]MBU9726425.1 helix-turn-helix domain-containing protein [Diplocloster modestus]
MLDKVLAGKFMERVQNYTDYNVNIMDEKGIIIASKDEKRVGSFHEVAYRILQGEGDEISVSEKDGFLGVKEGVNIAIVENRKRIGVIGITGKAREIKPIALVMKMAVETMLEYEHYKDDMARRRNEKEKFMGFLLYGGYRDRDELYQLAKRLNYKRHVVRIPILAGVQGGNEAELYSIEEQLLAGIKQSPYHGSQDISFIPGEGMVLIFKTVGGDAKNVPGRYRDEIRTYVESFSDDVKKKGIFCRYFVGSIQNSLDQYQVGFRHCQWLKDRPADNGETLFFYDFVDDYFSSLVPATELHGMFQAFCTALDGETKETLVELIRALDRNDYNLVKSSQDLFIHKNTLVFRLNKIRELLNVNPVQKTREREFLKYLCRYLESSSL